MYQIRIIILSLFLLFSVIPGISYADQTVQTLLSAVEATGASTASSFGQRREHTTQVVFTNTGGSLTALTVDLEGSLDGVTWFQIDTHVFTSTEITAKASMFHTVRKLVTYIRANITTLTETGTTAVTVQYIGAKYGL